jgi:hypothetical protein
MAPSQIPELERVADRKGNRLCHPRNSENYSNRCSRLSKIAHEVQSNIKALKGSEMKSTDKANAVMDELDRLFKPTLEKKHNGDVEATDGAGENRGRSKLCDSKYILPAT